MLSELEYKLSGKLWLYKGKGAWYFLTIPKEESGQIKFFANDGLKRGWGSIKVTATIGKTIWGTSIFPQSKSDTYILPVKAEIRKKEGLQENDLIDFELDVLF